MRLRGRVDANQKEIVKEIRKTGISVFILSNVGKGFPDIICGFRGKNFLFEIKDSKKTCSQKVLTVAEKEFFESWKGQVHKIETTEEVLNIIMGDSHA